LYVHIIFYIKNNGTEIRETGENELYRYMAAIIKEFDSLTIIINGIGNHIHILCGMSKILPWKNW
jgi:REP element-mobilizing transposase RayT